MAKDMKAKRKHAIFGLLNLDRIPIRAGESQSSIKYMN